MPIFIRYIKNGKIFDFLQNLIYHLEMKCPKCGYNIEDNASVCPKCKKVLKLHCPNCGSDSTSNTCKKCGFVIITKCHKCGKINPTINGTCTKCGFSTYTSASINSSNIDEFACVTVDFPNLDVFKKAFGPIKLFEKFKINLDNLIVNYTKTYNLKREIIDNTYIIRFNKSRTFIESAISAMEAAIEIQTLVTDLNTKLNKLTNKSLACNIAILKRDIYSKPSDYKSGFNIKLLYQHNDKSKILNRLQIITDSYIYNELSDKYALSALSAVMIKQTMVMFFELNLPKYIKVKKEDNKLKQSLQQRIEAIPEEDSQDSDLTNKAIPFNDIICSFLTTENINFSDVICNKIKNNLKNIISVKKNTDFSFDMFRLISNISRVKQYKNIISVNCNDRMLNSPYGLFSEILNQIYKFNQVSGLVESNDYTAIKDDDSGFIKSLISLSKRDFPHPEDCRYSLFDLFRTIFYNELKDCALIIDNAEKIDDTSLEFIQTILKDFSSVNTDIILIGSSAFSFHKNAQFLLRNICYTEIKLKRTKIKSIEKKYKNIFDVFSEMPYGELLIKNSEGNTTYVEAVVDYLFDKKILYYDNKKELKISKERDILIPTSIENVDYMRITKMQEDNPSAFVLLAELAFIGNCNASILPLLNFPKVMGIIKYLIDESLIFLNNGFIIVKNNEILINIFKSILSDEDIKKIAETIENNLYKRGMKYSLELELFRITDMRKEEFRTLQNLSEVSATLGDFSAYWNCCNQLLKMIDNHITEHSQEEIDKYKMQIYGNLANLLYKYTPEKIQNIAQILLEYLEKCGNDDEIVTLCNKMLQGCLISGNYSHALKLIHNILSRFPNKSINPAGDEFDVTFFMLTLVKIEILFSIGDLNDCAKAGEEILKLFTNINILDSRPEGVPEKQYNELIFDSFMFSGISKVLLLKNDLKTYLSNISNTISVGKKSTQIPECFEFLQKLENLLHGYNVETVEGNIYKNKFAFVLDKIILAFTKYSKEPEKFAKIIHKAKLHSASTKLRQFELFCDVMIGYSYLELNETEKASSIFYNVEKICTENGLKTVLYITWYLISLLKFREKEIDSAISIASDVSLKMEQSENSSDYLQFLFKELLKQLYLAKGANDKAEFCQKHINFLQMKYGLKVNN